MTLSSSDRRSGVAAHERLVWESLQRVRKGVSSTANHAQMFLMKACAAERVVKRVVVKRREPHLLQWTPASSRVRLSPRRAFSVSAVSSPRRMQCWHSTPMNRAPRPIAMSWSVGAGIFTRRQQWALQPWQPHTPRSCRNQSVPTALQTACGVVPTEAAHGRAETR